MKEFQIEKVDHSPMFEDIEKCCVVAYYKTSDTLSQANFMEEKNALLAKNTCTVGMWRVKPTDK